MDLFIVAFLILPVAALIARESGRLKLPLWLIFTVCVAVGWLLVNLSVERHFASLDELARSTPNPSDELLNRLQNDGASEVFALYFGWAYAAIYFLICLLALHLWRGLKRGPRSG